MNLLFSQIIGMVVGLFLVFMSLYEKDIRKSLTIFMLGWGMFILAVVLGSMRWVK